MTCFSTTFDQLAEKDSLFPSVRVVAFGSAFPVKHAFAPHIHRHSSGQLLYSCRWDDTGSEEGDSTNRQALYFSLDGGKTWTMANEGRPIIDRSVTRAFDEPSAITHSFVFEDRGGRTWLCYSVNQPGTWSREEPKRSTGGGSIGRILLEWRNSDWMPAGPRESIWQLGESTISEGATPLSDIRLVALNPIHRIDERRLLLPVAGRSTLNNPQGLNWKLNRSWALISEDDGNSWRQHSFIGGSDSLPLCEPCFASSHIRGEIFCLLRPGYGSFRQLYLSVSMDSGQTWSFPRPCGLPNPAGFGSKPCLKKGPDDRFYALLTNERDSSDRSNLGLFSTDRRGLLEGAWQTMNTLSVESRRQWAGACYGSLAFDSNGDVLAAWASFDLDSGYLNFLRLDPRQLRETVAEPNKVSDALGNDLPQAARIENRPAIQFHNTRGNIVANQFGRLTRAPFLIESTWLANALPTSAPFHFLKLSKHGEISLTLSLLPQANSNLWLCCNQGTVASLHDFSSAPSGWVDAGVPCPLDRTIEISCRIEENRSVRIELDGSPLLASLPIFLRTSKLPDTLECGGNHEPRDSCGIYCLRTQYADSGL